MIMIFDVIITGGSYAGLQAAMTLGRALKHVLVIDSGKPCNRQTPHSHNFLTRDGETPAAIAAKAREQAEKYPTVKFLGGKAINGTKNIDGFTIYTEAGEAYTAKKLLFTTGIFDVMPQIPGFAECWGISVIHCPYCHGYEVRGKQTGIIGNDDTGYEYARMISNWTNDLTLFTNGASTFNTEQAEKLASHHIKIVEDLVEEIEHYQGQIKHLATGKKYPLDAIYARLSFKQHCDVPQMIGCRITDVGYIEVDEMYQTSIPGIYAAGDCTSPMRSVAAAVSGGALAGVVISKELINEEF
jgi:thioredoxin reductase